MRDIRRSVRATTLVPVPTTRLAATLLAATLGLSACSDGGEEPSEPSEQTSVEPSAADPAAASLTLQGREPAVEDLRISACPAGEGSLTASGAVRNRAGKKPIDYVVTVSWLDEGGAVLTTEETSVEDVERRASQKWSVEAEVAETAASCTTQAARGTLP